MLKVGRGVKEFKTRRKEEPGVQGNSVRPEDESGVHTKQQRH